MRRLICALLALAVPIAPAFGQQLIRERVSLVVANASTGIATVYGGTYVVTQACATYGTVAMRYRDPNGVMVALVTKSAADTSGGTQVTLGSNQVVDATVSGGAGCNVDLARVPA